MSKRIVFLLVSNQSNISSIENKVGCVVVRNDSEIIASGQNQPVEFKNATRHAEICALDSLYAQNDLLTVQQVEFTVVFGYRNA